LAFGTAASCLTSCVSEATGLKKTIRKGQNFFAGGHPTLSKFLATPLQKKKIFLLYSLAFVLFPFDLFQLSSLELYQLLVLVNTE